MMPPKGLEIYLRYRVTLIFDLLAQMSIISCIARAPLVPMCIKFGSIVFKISRMSTSLVADERTDGPP